MSIAERPSLVTWDEVVTGEMIGEPWVCPTEGLGRINTMLEGDGIDPEAITDQFLMEHAGGRRQRLRLMMFPREGYHALEIVDTDTGAVVADQVAHQRYGGVRDTGDRFFAVPVPVVDRESETKSLPLDEYREVCGVANKKGCTITSIRKVSQDPAAGPSMFIIPDRELFIQASGPLGAQPDVDLSVTIQEASDRPPMATILLTSGGDFLTLVLDERGYVTHLDTPGGRLLGILGIELGVDPDASSGCTVTDSEQRQDISKELAKTLGHEGGKRLDLRLTASGLYAAMSKPSTDPAAEFVFSTDSTVDE